MKILILKTSSLGDIVHCFPIIKDIKKNIPDAEIDWVIEDSFKDLLSEIEDINQVLTSNFRDWKKNIFSPKSWIAFFLLRNIIAKNNYDVILDCQGLIRTALLIPFRSNSIGLDKDSIKEKPASLFYKKKIKVNKDQNAIDRNKIFASKALRYEINDSPRDNIQQISNQIDHKGPVIFFMGTSNDQKKWAVENWIKLCDWLHNMEKKVLLAWGSSKEYEEALLVYEYTKNSEILPRLTISEIKQLIPKCSLAIGVDTGLTHLALFLGIPSIGIYCASDPNRTGLKSTRKGLYINFGENNNPPSFITIKNYLENALEN